MTRWDHVIVGAGSSGAVVAERLSADPTCSVLVLEAGPDPAAVGLAAVVAGADFFAAAADPGLTWTHLQALPFPGAESQPYLQGRVLGGTGAVNAMVLQRPLPTDLERWERVHGAVGWAAPATAALVAAAFAEADPVGAREWGPLTAAWAAAAGGGLASGAPDAQRDGVSPAALARRGGRRWSSGERLTAASAGRANLTVRVDAPVDRVVLAGGRVVGVRLVGGGEVETTSVIVAAGALHSPGVLIRSGIERPGLGANLRDHPAIQLSFPLAIAAADEAPLVGVVERWSSQPGALDLVVTPLEHVADRGVGAVTIGLVAPHSVGRLLVPSADPLAEPIVELGHLGDERDLACLADAAGRLAARLAHPGLRDLAQEPVTIDAAATPVEALLDPDVARAWVPGALGGSYHAAGTCRMGPPDDPMAVVDHEGAVHGVVGLRVADASILPQLPRANPHLTCVVVGQVVAAALSR